MFDMPTIARSSKSALLGAFALIAAPIATAEPQHIAFTELLDRYVVATDGGETKVKYAEWTANAEDRAALDAYIDTLTSQDIRGIEDRDAQFAAWANLYNAVTLDVIMDNYPVKSIMNIRPGLFSIGPWKKKRVTVAGEKLSLDNIEHDILRVEWSDPRVHYAVNCASIGCPNLLNEAWEGDTLDADLDRAATDYINHSRGVTVNEDGTLTVSRIYKWFAEDFGGKAGLVDHFKPFAQSELKDVLEENPKVDGYEYDWSLNGLVSK